MKNLCFGMLLAAGFSTAQAGFLPEEFKLDNAQQLLDVCTVSTSHSNYLEAYGFCAGYFTGAMHYHRALAKGPDHKVIVCPDHTVTRAEAIAVFVAWARDNPQYMAEEPIEAVMRAAVARYPCKTAASEVSRTGRNESSSQDRR